MLQSYEYFSVPSITNVASFSAPAPPGIFRCHFLASVHQTGVDDDKGGEVVFQGDPDGVEDFGDFPFDFPLGYTVFFGNLLIGQVVETTGLEDVAAIFRQGVKEIPEDAFHVFSEKPLQVVGLEGFKVGEDGLLGFVVDGFVAKVVQAGTMSSETGRSWM